jgi:hypothetical protein
MPFLRNPLTYLTFLVLAARICSPCQTLLAVDQSCLLLTKAACCSPKLDIGVSTLHTIDVMSQTNNTPPTRTAVWSQLVQISVLDLATCLQCGTSKSFALERLPKSRRRISQTAVDMQGWWDVIGKQSEVSSLQCRRFSLYRKPLVRSQCVGCLRCVRDSCSSTYGLYWRQAAGE